MPGKIVHEVLVSQNPHPKHPKYFLRDLVLREDGGGLSVHRGKIEPGGEILVHTHETEYETFYILSGRAECTMGDEVKSFTAGSCGFASPGVPHGLKNVGDEPVELLAIFTPPLK